MSMVLNLRGKAGFIQPYGGTEVPVYEKFYVGGSGTVRGFEYGTAGPVDQNGEALGANRMVVGNAELIFPLAKEIGLKGAFFFDVGKGWGLDKNFIVPLVPDPNNPGQLIKGKPIKIKDPSVRTGAGFGIRWFSPFGPIHIDLGFNLSPKNNEKGHVIEFNAGSTY
jgi:outer membrane protein insertion porin family